MYNKCIFNGRKIKLGKNMKTKYIRNQHRFIVFPSTLQHREMARKCLGENKIIHGAGFMFLFFEDNKIKADCYGTSESLKVSPRRDDCTVILKSIGVENPEDNEVQHAKYIIYRDNVIVFNEEIEHKNVAMGAFNSTNCESAGFVKFLVHLSGKIKVQCYGESSSLGIQSRKDDYKLVAELMEIPEGIIFNPPALNLKN